MSSVTSNEQVNIVKIKTEVDHSEKKKVGYYFFEPLQTLQMPEDYECFKGMTLSDIPKQFIQSIRMPQPYQGMVIDAPDGKIFKKAAKYVDTIPESARGMFLEEINQIFTTNKNERAVVTFSVRSMLDLYLTVRKFPPGSEIIMTGVNIPDMVKIMAEHKIVVVPVDLDIATLKPNVSDVKKAISPKTKAVLFAYIFGVTYDIAPYVEILNAANVEIIEDCAQSWRSLEKFRGSDFATMTMFSFGMIKHNTAFYGGVTVIRSNNETHRAPHDKLLHQKVEEVQETYELYSPEAYKKKISDAWKIWMMLTKPFLVANIYRYFCLLGKDQEEEMIQKLRGFPPNPNVPYLNKYHIKPSAPLIKMIIDQTKSYSHKDHLTKIENFNRMAVALSANGTFIPGYCSYDRSYWLFPLLVPNRDLFKKFCEAQGVFCYIKTT